MPRRATVSLLLVVLGVLVVPGALAGAGVAAAHGPTDGSSVRIEQTLGGHDLTLTLAPPAGTGTMPVLVAADADTPPGSVRLAVVAPGAPVPPDAPSAAVRPGSRARGDLAVTRSGPVELAVTDGRDVARIPLDTAPPAGAARGWVALGGFAVAAVGTVAAASMRTRPRSALAVGAVALVGLTVGLTIQVVAPAETGRAAGVGGAARTAASGAAAAGGHAGHGGAAVPTAPTEPVTTAAPVGMQVRTEPGAPVAGLPVGIVLELTDTTAGAPVDDLAVHDEALLHLVVAGPGGAFVHQHPVRVGPGRYLLRPVLPAPGRYLLVAEIERSGGGAQLLRTALDVPTGPTVPRPTPPPAPGPGPRDVDGLRAEVAVSGAGAVAGRPVRLAMTLSAGGTPVRDLQAWLGMGAHLLVLGPGADGSGPADPGADPAEAARPVAHAHDMRPPSPSGGYGPEVAFSYTFPRAGRYLLWMQVRRDDRVVTVPVTVDVAPVPTGA